MKKKVGIITALLAVSAAVALAAVGPGTYSATITDANAPNGTHFAGRSSAPTCTVDSNLSVTCGDGTGSASPYQLAGVGNINATAVLSAIYTATVVCINNGSNPSDSQHQGSFPTTTGPLPLHSDKNGRLAVPSLNVQAPSTAAFLSQQTCPNPNWIPTVPGGISLQSFSYTLTFQNFPGAYITIAQP